MQTQTGTGSHPPGVTVTLVDPERGIVHTSQPLPTRFPRLQAASNRIAAALPSKEGIAQTACIAVCILITLGIPTMMVSLLLRYGHSDGSGSGSGGGGGFFSGSGGRGGSSGSSGRGGGHR